MVARVRGEVTVKRFFLDEDCVRLEPANCKYRCIRSSEVEIVGIVVQLIKDME